jgi:hypothetical protein
VFHIANLNLVSKLKSCFMQITYCIFLHSCAVFDVYVIHSCGLFKLQCVDYCVPMVYSKVWIMICINLHLRVKMIEIS